VFRAHSPTRSAARCAAQCDGCYPDAPPRHLNTADSDTPNCRQFARRGKPRRGEQSLWVASDPVPDEPLRLRGQLGQDSPRTCDPKAAPLVGRTTIRPPRSVATSIDEPENRGGSRRMSEDISTRPRSRSRRHLPEVHCLSAKSDAPIVVALVCLTNAFRSQGFAPSQRFDPGAPCGYVSSRFRP